MPSLASSRRRRSPPSLHREREFSSGRKRLITTQHKLLTDQWTSDVATVERAIDRMATDRVVTNACRVVLFEAARDGLLHVNVTHKHQTKSVAGWAGPAGVADGFVNNRTFDGPPARIAGHIRRMIFAAR